MLTRSQCRYLIVETAISVAINTVISIGFVYLAFGGQAQVATAALIPDAVPQSFMIALMSTVVPTMLTRRRRRAGLIEGHDNVVPDLLRSLPVRALLFAVITAVAGFAASALLIGTLAPPQLPFAAVLTGKAVYGALLAAVVTPFALTLALADRIETVAS